MISRMKFAKLAIVGMAISASPAALAQTNTSIDGMAAEHAAGAPFIQAATSAATQAAPVVAAAAQAPVHSVATTAAPVIAQAAAPVVASHQAAAYHQPTYHQPVQHYAPAQAYPVQYTREQWLEECYARTGGKSNREKGNIIGGLLGAVAGGVIGNRVWDSERLAGTLIGAGTGGLLGAVAGGLLGGKKRSSYDCEAVLDSHLAAHSSGQYQTAAPQQYYTAARTIPAPQYTYAPVQTYAQPVMMVETQVAVPQRAVVREYVTEEWVEETVRERVIEEPRPVKRVPIKRVPVKYVKD